MIRFENVTKRYRGTTRPALSGVDFEVQRAAKDRPAAIAEAGASLLPADVTTAPEPEEEERKPGREERIDADSVFARLKGRHQDDEDDDA